MSNVKQFTDKLEKLNYENMYNGDFFLTWEKTPSGICARTTSPPRYSTVALASACSGTIPPVPASPSLPPATCWAWKCRTWTRARAR